MEIRYGNLIWLIPISNFFPSKKVLIRRVPKVKEKKKNFEVKKRNNGIKN